MALYKFRIIIIIIVINNGSRPHAALYRELKNATKHNANNSSWPVSQDSHTADSYSRWRRFYLVSGTKAQHEFPI